MKVRNTLHTANPGEGSKPRTYRKKARKQFLRFIRNRKPRENEVRRAIRTQLQYVERNIRNIKEMLKAGEPQDLTRKQWRDLRVIQEYIRQQRKLYRERTLGGSGRIVSLAKPHVRAIARGKARGMFEFGAKLTVSLVEGYACVERLSWENYNEGTELKDQLEAHRKRYGAYPEVVCADKIFRNRENLEYCRERGIRLSGPKLGRPYGDEARKKEQRRIERMDESTRQAIEGKFGEVKTRYSLDRIATRLQETSEGAIQMVFLLANLARVLRIRIANIFVRLFVYIVKIMQWANRHPEELTKQADFYGFELCQ